MTKLSSLKLRFIGIPTSRHFNSMVPTFKRTEKDRSNHRALWRTPKTRLVTWFIYDHQRKLLSPGKTGLNYCFILNKNHIITILIFGATTRATTKEFLGPRAFEKDFSRGGQLGNNVSVNPRRDVQSLICTLDNILCQSSLYVNYMLSI